MCIQEEISQVNNKENETTRLVGKLHVIGRGTFPYTIYYCQNQRHFFFWAALRRRGRIRYFKNLFCCRIS